MKTLVYLLVLFPWSAAVLVVLRFVRAQRKPEAVAKQ